MTTEITIGPEAATEEWPRASLMTNPNPGSNYHCGLCGQMELDGGMYLCRLVAGIKDTNVGDPFFMGRPLCSDCTPESLEHLIVSIDEDIGIIRGDAISKAVADREGYKDKAERNLYRTIGSFAAQTYPISTMAMSRAIEALRRESEVASQRAARWEALMSSQHAEFLAEAEELFG